VPGFFWGLTVVKCSVWLCLTEFYFVVFVLVVSSAL